MSWIMILQLLIVLGALSVGSRYDTRNYQLVINMDEINEDEAVNLILAYIKSMAA